MKQIAFVLSLPVLVFGWYADANLVDIQAVHPGIVVELRYATTNNFTGQIVYPFQTCFLREEAALALSRVQEKLAAIGLGLKIWDGYRPLSAQWKFWELVPDERYVSNPLKGGRHTRGTAVDLTIITQEGEELPMPSLFDDFSEKAHRNYSDCSGEEKKNRDLLQTVMAEEGFESLPTEWWHFDFHGWQNIPPIEMDNASFGSPLYKNE